MSFTLEELGTEEGRSRYYKVNLADRSTWRNNLVEPYLDPVFNEELLERYGTDAQGNQKIRISWAVPHTKRHYKVEHNRVTPYTGRKYPYRGAFRLRITRGYIYTDNNGKKVTVTEKSNVPKDKVFVEDSYYDDLAERKFVAEMRLSLPEMIALGLVKNPSLFPNQGMKNGVRFKDEPNPSGDYVFLFFCQDKFREYRDVTFKDIQRIHDVVNRSNTETDLEYLARKTAERALAMELDAADKRKKEFIHWERAWGRAEKRVARGKIEYSK